MRAYRLPGGPLQPRIEPLVHLLDQIGDSRLALFEIFQYLPFALFALVEKKVIGLDLTVALIVLASAWLLAHLF